MKMKMERKPQNKNKYSIKKTVQKNTNKQASIRFLINLNLLFTSTATNISNLD